MQIEIYSCKQKKECVIKINTIDEAIEFMENYNDKSKILLFRKNDNDKKAFFLEELKADKK